LTDISIKNRITAIVAYIVAASVLTVQYHQPTAIIYFFAVGIVLLLSDKLFDRTKVTHPTVTAFVVSVLCNQTFFQIFYKTHDSIKQLLTALAVAAFLTGVFALTDEKKYWLSFVAAPIISLANYRIAFCYCILTLSFSVVKLLSVEKRKTESVQKGKKKNASAQTSLPTYNLLIISAVISAVCLLACIYPAIKDVSSTIENYRYFLIHFKNSPFILIASVYLLIRLLKGTTRAKAVIIVGFALHVISAVAFCIIYGWTMLSLFLISCLLFCALNCLEYEIIADSIKADFSKHKYLLSALILCMFI
jgi:hypothetical protein